MHAAYFDLANLKFAAFSPAQVRLRNEIIHKDLRQQRICLVLLGLISTSSSSNPAEKALPPPQKKGGLTGATKEKKTYLQPIMPRIKIKSFLRSFILSTR